MGRPIGQREGENPPGFYQDANMVMLQELWLTLAATAHPELLRDNPRPSLEQLFAGDWLKDVTWADFWQVFPYELRDHCSYFDELDALGLLLASPVNKQRFQRYFEHHAAFITQTSSAAAPGNLEHEQAQRAQLAGNPAGLRTSPLEQNQLLPIRRRGQQQPLLRQQQQSELRPPPPPLPPPQQQQQQQQALLFHLQPPARPTSGAVAYVGPTGQAGADGRVLAAAHAGPPQLLPTPGALPWGPEQQFQQHQLETLVMRALGLDASQLPRVRAAAAAATTLVAAAGPALAAAAPALAAPALGAVTGNTALRLSGRRRTWMEACMDPDAAAEQPLQQQQAAANGAGSSAAAAATGAAGAAGNNDQQLARQQQPQPAPVDNRRVWQAVHEMLTCDDEALLLVVSRLLPVSFSEHLRDATEVQEQLQHLADSRVVPSQVVSSLADRMSAASDIQLLQIMSSSGYSRRAAAAAAALAAGSGRHLCYIPLAGCYQEEEVEAALMKGIFSNSALENAAVCSAAAAPAVVSAEESSEPAAEDAAPLQQQQQLGPPAARGAPAAAVNVADAPVAAPAASPTLILREDPAPPAPPAPTAPHAPHAPPVAAATAVAPGSIEEVVYMEESDQDVDDEYGDDEDDEREDWGDGEDTRGYRRIFRAASLPAAAAEPAEAVAPGVDVEQLNAYLALLGTCSKQPLLVFLDEVDAAMMGPQGGMHFRGLLLRLLCSLPQALVVLTCSHNGHDVLCELRRQGRAVQHKLPDGVLQVYSYRCRGRRSLVAATPVSF